MNTIQAKTLAIKLMKDNTLDEWKFEFDYAVNRFGCCKISKKLITLSKALVELNDESQVRDTILHEIAHALVGKGHGHDFAWKAKAQQIGCAPSRCYTSDVIQPKAKYQTECPNCHRMHTANRKRRKIACGRCCKEFNKGRWSKKYILKYKNYEEGGI